MFRAVDSEDISRSTSPTNNTESPSRDGVQFAAELEESRPHATEISLKMIIRELLFCLAFGITTYGALHTSHTKVSKQPQAVRFFSRQSPVEDWYQGELNAVLEVINHADISFVMYYAPWDAECQHVRREFEKAAAVLGDKVYFTAINCWNPGSECKLHHNKIPSWPIIMAYTVTSKGVIYKGPRDAESMISFLQLVMRPLKRVTKSEDIINLLSICEAVALGYTPLSAGSRDYNVWYNVALKALEYDSLGEICFATVTSEGVAVDLGVEMVPNARLMLWNVTKEYSKQNAQWNSTALLKWVLESFSQPVARIVPLWKKAFSFERFFDGSPILILFTPMNPLYELVPYYALLREVAMEYYNCANHTNKQWISELMKLQKVQRLVYQQRNVTKFCKEYSFKKAPSTTLYKTSHYKYPWFNSTQKDKKSVLPDILTKKGLFMSASKDASDIFNNVDVLTECSNTLFPAEKDFYNVYEQCQTLEDNLDNEEEISIKNFGTSMLPLLNDALAPENIVQDHIKNYCKLVNFAYKTGAPLLPASEDGLNISSVSGLACARNFSLNMITVDSLRNFHFAESLGIDISKRKDMTAAVILDAKRETQYVLNQEYNAKSIREFIYNFTYMGLKRHLRSHVADAAHTHYYRAAAAAADSQSRDNSSAIVDIVELTTTSFKKLVNTPGELSLICVCDGECGALVMRAAVSAARLLRRCGVAATVARVDARRHDLPWHYTAHLYPTLLVMPPNRKRKAESYRHPISERISASSFVALALRALGPPLNVRVRLQLCQSAKWNTEKKSCLREVREHVSSLLERNLSYWRRTENHLLKAALFTRLQRLHTVYFDITLLNVPDLHPSSSKQTTLLQSLDSLGKHWHIDTATIVNCTKVKS